MQNPVAVTSVENEEEEQPCPTCHMVANPDSQFWICCDECNTWYHDVCEGLTSMVTSDTYICLNCRKKRRFWNFVVTCRCAGSRCCFATNVSEDS